MYKNNKGITLIALIITIIVMLILVAVTISMAVNGGLFEYAGKAVGETKNAIKNEQQLDIDEIVNKYVNQNQEFNAEEWDEDAAPTDIFRWASDDPNNEDYGVIVGYNASINNYSSLRIPSRCTKIIVDDSYMQATSDLTIEQIRSFTENIKEIELPETIVEIGQFAFGRGVFEGYNFTSLQKINIPNSVTTIGKSAFGRCTSLATVVIPDSVITIGDSVFIECTGLTSVTIPDSVTSIKDYTFYKCTGLTSVIIPESVTSIGNNAFWGCSGLTSVTIPASVTSISNNVFSECSGLASIKIDENNTKYDSRNNCNAIIESETNSLISGCKNTIIPNGVLSIDGGAFYRCVGLTSIEIPDGVTKIDNIAFYECSNLTSVTIPDSVKSIGPSAFYGCSGLTSVTIPDTVGTIWDNAFYNVPHITYNGTASGEPWGALSMN